MHLKEIRMENFKTFRKKVTVPIYKGFTGITGPNGSGKSNIADAILFVLGPRSSKMVRARRLSDLIFHGNDRYRPASQCHVALIFDNKDRLIPVDNDEVELKRVLKISPSDPNQTLSYFYVNGRVSSQGEFENILTHAHLSAEGYNIVLQGHVAEFVNKTPVKIREEIDDIAGIRKYDEEISNAQVKKARTLENMEKIKWHLDFLRSRLRELKKEKDEAEKFRSAQNEINLTKATLNRVLKDAIEGELRSYNEAIANAEKRKIELRSEIDVLEVERERLEGDKRQLEKEIADISGEEGRRLKEKLDGARLEMMRARDMIESAQDTISELNKEAKLREMELKDITKKKALLEKEIASIDSTMETIETEIDEAKTETSSIEEGMARSDMDLLGMRRDLGGIVKRLESERDALSRTTIEREKALAQREGKMHIISDIEQMVSILKYEAQDAKKALAEMEREDQAKNLKKLQKEFMEQRAREKHMVSTIKDLEAEITQLNRLYTSLKVEYETSEKLKKGVSMAVDDILSARDMGEIRGIYGTIGELGKVKQEYSLAMEVAAGGRVSAIIVDDDSVASQCIERLKKKRLGRATFLPLNKVKGRKPGAKALMVMDDPHVIGNAVDLIQFDQAFAQAFSWVFGDTIVVEGMDTLRRVMGGVRVVTLTGEIAGVGGDITGGSLNDRKDSSSFGRRSPKDLDDVSNKLKEKIGEADSATLALNEIRERVNALESSILKITSGERDMESRRRKLEEVREQSETNLGEREKELDQRRSEITELDSTISRCESEMEELSGRVESLSSERDGLAEKVEQMTPKAMRDRLRELRTRYDDLLSRKGALVEEREKGKGQMRLFEEKMNELRSRGTSIEKALEQASSEIGSARSREEKHMEEVKALETVLSSIDSKTRDLYQKLTEIGRAQERVQSKRESCRSDLMTQDQVIITQRANIRIAEDKLADVLRELRVHENIDIGPGPYPSERELMRKVRDLEAILERAGNVNLKALEEYEDMEKKKEQIGSEFKALEREKSELESLIDEIHSKRTTEFIEAFKGIDENFRRIYTLISGEGTAHFELENPEDPLSGGLNIRVKPPGKKMTNLYSLSGGEKSLTSMAFIFSVQAWDPSPFYLLDEIDQNLDAVNAEIIAKMIAENSRSAQFVLVSLRKITLKEAHHLYGVTLQDGNSVMVGRVDLKDVEEYEKQASREATPTGGEV
ncbi:MAG: chromosome segregation protein SMC [Candidatus Thermoplasmatota archaeon]|nr:chromosome segregation protein SMC [Candidatus Thermoplasmatota archaeon]